jgi:hypothetical protein
MDGTKPDTVIDKGINTCEGLAIDWIGRNIYWTDEALSSIHAASLETPQYRKLLVSSAVMPRSIVVNPKEG